MNVQFCPYIYLWFAPSDFSLKGNSCLKCQVEVISLPSFEYQEELFFKEVKTLRKRFVNSASDGGLAGDETDEVPNSDFSYSITTIWNSIRENKDLDLPKHKIMVDTVRCDQIVQKCYSDFVGYKEWQDLDKSVKYAPIEGFGAKLSSIINTCLSQYDTKVSHYDENVRITKRETLLQQLLKCVQSAREAALEHQYHKAVCAFKKAFDNADQRPGKFLASTRSCLEYSKSVFAQGCKEIEVEHVKLDASKVFERVERDIHQYVEYVTLKREHAKAEAAVAAAAVELAANKALSDKAADDAKIAADTLAAAYAKAASDAEILVQQAKMAEIMASTAAAAAAAETQKMIAELKAQQAAAEQDELIASTAATTAATLAMLAEMKAERAAAEQREREQARLAREKKEECTIQ